MDKASRLKKRTQRGGGPTAQSVWDHLGLPAPSGGFTGGKETEELGRDRGPIGTLRSRKTRNEGLHCTS